MDVSDVMEEILIRSAVQDLVPWKRVCKSWYSLISSSRFVKLHLKKTCNNNDSSKSNKGLGHIRIVVPSFWDLPNQSLYDSRNWKVVGSSNGLVCLSPLPDDALVLVNNPCTGETRKLPMAPLVSEKKISTLDLCLSFGYDSLTDDYKVVMGIWKNTKETLILVFSLKSNTWKFVGEFKYRLMHSQPGILYSGALHWFVLDYSTKKNKKVIVSFDLSYGDFKVIPQPSDSQYNTRCSLRSLNMLGILEDQLCIFFPNINNENDLPHDIWVMRNYNVEQSWERLPTNYEMKYEAVHFMKMPKSTSFKKNMVPFFCDDDKCLSKASKYINAHRFAPSLVSPYADTWRPSLPRNNKTSVTAWSIQVAEGERQHSQANIRNFIEASELVEEVCKLEVGESENLYLHNGE